MLGDFDKQKEMVQLLFSPCYLDLSDIGITEIPEIGPGVVIQQSKMDEIVILSSYNKCKSFEQMWLAVVMKEKYNKIWNGTEWEGGK